MGFSGGSGGKELPAMQETWVLSVVWEDPLEEGIATHSSILAWIIPTDRGAWGIQSMGDHKESDMTERLSTTTTDAGTSSIKNAGIYQHCKAAILQ